MLQIATPEKALLDLLYLYPFYKTQHDMEELRLDEEFMNEEFNWEIFDEYLLKFNNKSLQKRAKILKDIYKI